MSRVLKFYQKPGLSPGKTEEILSKLRSLSKNIKSVDSEYCCYIQWKDSITDGEKETIRWILSPSFEAQVYENESKLRGSKKRISKAILVEIGPRLNFSTAYSTNAVSVFRATGLKDKVMRIERSTLYLIEYEDTLDKELEEKIISSLFDKMTEQKYDNPITSFELPMKNTPWVYVDIMGEGKAALQRISEEMGLSFDSFDLEYYTNLFRDKLKRNPTSVECFDLAQSNSEHSRHWFFKGLMVVDDVPLKESLFEMISNTQKYSNKNNVIAFSDNSSSIRGFGNLHILSPVNSTEASLFHLKQTTRHLIFTAETHNFPTGVSPFQGATTGTGGRIRDVQAAGRGSHVVAGTAGYSFGNLLIPGYTLPWESPQEIYPNNFASPLDICIEASNGASDYGNKFGEPVLTGFSRSFGLRLPSGERREWIKPIMFSGGLGSIDDNFVKKYSPEEGMLVVKIGGPIYRIGIGGGAASSVEIQGDSNNEDLDFGAVQRGDPEMEQKLNRFIRSCLEYDDFNPIQSIHDQGAGGNGNVLKEIVEPKGAIIYTKNFSLGDPTINTLELWGAEFQESDAILVKKENKDMMEKISKREKCPMDIVGHITGDGYIKLIEGNEKLESKNHPVDLNLEYVLGSMPQKVFNLKSEKPTLKPLSLPQNLTLLDALQRVLRLPSVASKRYLTTKVDRSVTGLVAQQQCIGPLHTPLADYAITALSYFDVCGAATSIGEQPIKGLLSPAAMARLSVGEAITNLMFARITDLKDVKCSGNWMWAAKLPGEGAQLVQACQAMCEVMKTLGIAIDGGKDSLSMAAKVQRNKKAEIVKSPGTLVISTYAPVPDIRIKVTPELQGDGKIIYVNLSGSNKIRCGGSALAQVYGQIGNECPDLDKPELLRDCFYLVQNLISSKDCTAGHDISDGGVITTLLEMAFATNCGVRASFNSVNQINDLFGEECGVLIEIKENSVKSVVQQFKKIGLDVEIIGEALFNEDLVLIEKNGQKILKAKMTELRDIWEETSFELDKRQANNKCVSSEQVDLKKRTMPKWKITFDPHEVELRPLNEMALLFASRPSVAVIREEGTNGDREMIASLYMVGFQVADVMITDILGDRKLNLDIFRGLIFPGGFSYADVLGSARGWAATMKFNPSLMEQLKRFKARNDTFSLGVCNGCQLLALLGWVGAEEDGSQGTLFAPNDSARFESRFVSVKIEEGTKSMMLKGMEGSAMGVWIAHGEGKTVFKNDKIERNVENGNLVALRYVDDNGKTTLRYPMNPNGSVNGIAGLCSTDGRHLAMMPHPERCTQMWQWPYLPKTWDEIKISPWTKMFYNAYRWSCFD